MSNQVLTALDADNNAKNTTNQFFHLKDYVRLYKNAEVNDTKFIEYISSLCAIHTTDTERHINKEFQRGLEFSPYVDRANQMTTCTNSHKLSTPLLIRIMISV